MAKRTQKSANNNAQYKAVITQQGNRILIPANDATMGQYEAFRPADYQKPQAEGLIKRITRVVLNAFKTPDAANTTERGAAGAAAPSLYQMTLLQQRFERREKIADVRNMVFQEPRARRSTLKFAREASRGGVRITINKEANKNTSAQTLALAQTACEEVQAIVNRKLRSWGWMLIVEGDLFVQYIVSNNRVTNAKRMPAVSMERLTDDSDEFIDKARAYSQTDVLTNDTLTTFSCALMSHARWNHIDGERYGESELIAGRRICKLLELMEEAQGVRRMTRATQRTLWNIKGGENTAGMPADVQKFRDDNGFIEGNREIFDPNEIARDFFSNGFVEMQTQTADTGVSDIADLKYSQNTYASSVLPTPPPLYNLDAEAVNRDVLSELLSEFLKETKELSDTLRDEIIEPMLKLSMLLKGVLPKSVAYSIHFSESSIEKPSERVERVLNLRKNASADFQPDPLISRKKAIELIAEDADIFDVSAEIKAIDAELEEKRKQQQEQQAEQLEMQQELSPQGGSAQPKEQEQEPAKAAQDTRRFEYDVDAIAKRVAYYLKQKT